MAESKRDQLFKQALDHLRDTGRLHPDLKLPSFISPPTVPQSLAGYQDGEFNPLQLGVACIIEPQGRPISTQGAKWNHNPVSSLPPHPSGVSY